MKKSFFANSIRKLAVHKASLTVFSVLLAFALYFLSSPQLQVAQAAAPEAPAPASSPAPAAPPQQRIQPEAAFALVSGEAEKGNAAAMLTLGQFFEQGVGVARNYGKALEWYNKAAQAGQPGGYYNVGVCYEIGMGTAPDMTRAVQSFNKAAELGLAQAMYKLSAVYISGSGVSQDMSKGVSWLAKAADAGLAQAANELGLVYLSGLLGQKKNEKKALEMFNKAADLGSLEAIKNVALVYKDGLGVKANPSKAYSWFLIARRGGYAGEDIARVLGLLEGSLSKAQLAQAQKEADSWLENYAKRQQGGQ